MILTHPPLGARSKKAVKGALGISSTSTCCLFLQKIVAQLSSSGRGAVVVAGEFFNSRSDFVELRAFLEKNMLLKSIIELPSNAFEFTSLKAYVLILDRTWNSRDVLYYKKDSNETYEEVISFLKSKKTSLKSFVKSLDDSDGYVRPQQLIVEREIAEREAVYSDFEEYQMSDDTVFKKIISINAKDFDNLVESAETVYLLVIGNSDVVLAKESMRLKPQNYFQVTLNTSIISREYFAFFVKTDLGKSLLGLCLVGVSTIPRLNIHNLKRIMKIYAPSLESQKQIVEVDKLIKDVQGLIQHTYDSFSLNPNIVTSVSKKVREAKKVFEGVSAEDQILKIIAKKECKTVEFKSILKADCLKDIVAFMNTDGGDLLVGVDDDGNIVGIEADERYESDDEYGLILSSSIRDCLSKNVSGRVSFDIYTVSGKKVLWVSCPELEEGFAFYKGEYILREGSSVSTFKKPLDFYEAMGRSPQSLV